jgi:acyl-CoA synthetase (AMP-forming)/AMP-acid ligase II
VIIVISFRKNRTYICSRTKETFVDGWVHTGDEVIMKDGEVYIVDRLKVATGVLSFWHVLLNSIDIYRKS